MREVWVPFWWFPIIGEVWVPFWWCPIMGEVWIPFWWLHPKRYSELTFQIILCKTFQLQWLCNIDRNMPRDSDRRSAHQPGKVKPQTSMVIRCSIHSLSPPSSRKGRIVICCFPHSYDHWPRVPYDNMLINGGGGVIWVSIIDCGDYI